MSETPTTEKLIGPFRCICGAESHAAVPVDAPDDHYVTQGINSCPKCLAVWGMATRLQVLAPAAPGEGTRPDLKLLAIAGLVNSYHNDGTTLSAAETLAEIAKVLGPPMEAGSADEGTEALRQLLEMAAPDFCSMRCPSSFSSRRAKDQPRHIPECDQMRAAIRRRQEGDGAR